MTSEKASVSDWVLIFFVAVVIPLGFMAIVMNVPEIAARVMKNLL